jgi:class 3 adenylate cyclase
VSADQVERRLTAIFVADVEGYSRLMGIDETDKAIALAPNLGDVTREKAQACGIIRIPRRAVIRVWRL